MVALILEFVQNTVTCVRKAARYINILLFLSANYFSFLCFLQAQFLFSKLSDIVHCFIEPKSR